MWLLLAVPACRPGMAIPVYQPVAGGPSPEPTTKRSEFASLPQYPGQTVARSNLAAPTAVVVAQEKEPVPLPPVLRQPERNTISMEPVPQAEAAVKPSAGDSPLTLALRDFQEGRPDAAVKQLDRYEKANQELLLQLIPSLVQIAKLDLGKPDVEETGTLARQLEAAASLLARRSKLNLKKCVLCNAVKSFGLYTPADNLQALWGGSPYLLYVEVGNVPSHIATQGDGSEWYQTKLECSMQVRDDKGVPLEMVNVNAKSDTVQTSIRETKSELTRSPIHDYFIRSQFETPKRPGLYSVAFEIRDPASGQTVSKSIPFRVHAP